MLLGKRPRPPIKRTTSMTGITVDIPNMESSDDPSDPHHHDYATHVGPEGPAPAGAAHHLVNLGRNNYDQRFLTAMVSPRYNYQQSSSSSSNDQFIETAHFLRTCGLCRRQLATGKDIYMYRGDAAFCSLECREQQMKQDERKEKVAASSSKNKEETHKNNAAASSKKSETVVAA